MTREIPLTQGKVALVDDDDYEELSKYKWCVKKRSHTCYAKRSSKTVDGVRHTILMHTVILGTPKGMETDHINGNGLDNRKENLRVVDTRGNAQNRHIEKTSKFPGVYWQKDIRKWRATIRVDGIRKHLGVFIFEIDAANAYFEAYKSMMGCIPVAQQAPAGPCKDCTDPNQCYVPCHQVPKNPCIERGCTDIEDCDEICVHSRIFSPNWVKEHDAALIAQEREKWERERAEEHRTYESCHKHFACPDGEECWYSSADYYWDCGEGATRLAKAAAQAREDVLKRLHLVVPLCDALIEKFDCQSQLGFNALLIKRELESLRSEVGK